MAVEEASATPEFWLYGYGLGMKWKHSPKGIASAIDATALLTTIVCISQDHRGTPEAPGRVVTLIERSYWEQLTDHHDSAPERVWGVAYRIIPEKVAEVKQYLDIREINGYSIHYAPFHPADGSPSISTLVYIGTPDNDQFVGPQDPQKLAEHILRSQGPSGPNKDYLLSLDTALNELAPDSGDLHIHDLARRVRELESNYKDSSKLLNPTPSAHQQKHSTEEAEEIEEPNN
ncbi:cation transporter [Fusarium albosuccineum]|uniref:glutathione-specific gamma-glutamylcyclotransferase n=1 Tax=Fusarium albosuccineum TaxID=1237068 RepID=A0A8H4LHX8_9HYPO|nr:cation transporter [Fusarium albosuccineum]